MNTQHKLKQAVIAGATGLVGQALLNELLHSDLYDKVYVLSRRALAFEDPRIEVIEVDYDHLDNYTSRLSANHYYCCLGSPSWKSNAQQGLQKVDYEYCLALGILAEADTKCTQFLAVTSIGASPTSSIPYNQIKGRLERELKRLRLYGMHIFRPSLLLGKRQKSRLWEEIGKALVHVVEFFMVGHKGNFLSIKAAEVARAMRVIACSEHEGIHIYAPSAMRRISKHA